MKKLHKLIVKSYLGPFVLTFFITLFIFVMQFLWKYIDELVGKGLEWYLVAELLFYASANLVPMALPLAILLASIMTFGSFGEHYELVAMKSSGMSLMSIMYPLLIVTVFTSVGAFLFTNHIWPKSNLEFATLLYDIRHKKPAFDITEGVYYDGIEGYVIRVGSKEKDGVRLNDVLIYDHTKNNGNVHVIRADSGRMEMQQGGNYLVFQLYDGTSYEEVQSDKSEDRPHMLSSFKEEVLRFDLSGFKME
ncbi:MAG: LptF/LptG family permease, partial [Salibacteraceae bacterium]